MRSTWNDLVDGALPKRKLKLDRALLIPAIISLVEEWPARDKHAELEATAIRQMAAICDAVEAAIVRNTTDGDSFEGVIEKALAELAEVNASAPYNRGHKLFLACQQISVAIDEARLWNKFNRPGNHRPKTGLATRVWELRDLCCRQAGMTVDEFEGFLDTFNEKSGLSKVSLATLKGALTRAKKKRKVTN